jgi:hypothetical protein
MAGPVSLWSFAGTWTLSRLISHAGGDEDRFAGQAVFSRSGPKLIHEETGVLETSSGRYNATRRYVWAEASGRIEVSFDDMRPFHTIPLGETRPETVHLCDPDRYHVAYDFTVWPRWRTVWTVEGPRKSYVMESAFAPA